MDIAVKVSNPRLRAIEEAQKALTKAIRDLIDEKNALLADINQMLPQKDKLIIEVKGLEAAKVALYKEMDQKTATVEEDFAAHTKNMEGAKGALEKDIETFTLERTAEENRLSDLASLLEEKELKIAKKLRKVQELTKNLEDMEKDMAVREQSVQDAKEKIHQKEATVIEEFQKIKQEREKLNKKITTIATLEFQAEEKEKALENRTNQLQELLTTKTAQLKLATDKVSARDKQYNFQFKALKAMQVQLKRKEIRIKDRETVANMNAV